MADLVVALEQAARGQSLRGWASACPAPFRRRAAHQERQLHMAERPCAADRSRPRARSAGARRQRRRLLRAVGGVGWRGAGAETVFGVIIGTGTGGGVVVHRRLLRGPNAIAGEWGHNMLPWPRDDERPGPTCYCGRTAASRRSCRAPGSSRTMSVGGGQPARPARRSAGARVTATPRRRDAGALRASARPRSRQRHQPDRSARHRPRRRHVQHSRALSTTCRAAGATWCSPIASTRAWCRATWRFERRARRGVAMVARRVVGS